MIQINANSEYNTKRLERLIRSFNSGRYQFDLNALNLAVQRFTEEAESESDKVIQENKRKIAMYLHDIIIANLNKFNRIRVKWTVEDDGTVRTVPVQLINMRWCGLDILKYTYKTDEHKVIVSYRELWDALAFVIAHDDLGYNLQEIEEKIKDCSIVSINDGKILCGAMDENAYNDVCVMRIESSLYVDKEGDTVTAKNYFGEPLEKVEYKEIINSSVKRMMNCIISELLNSLSKNEYSIEFLGLFEDRLYFNTNMDKGTIKRTIGQGVVLRMFGRYFEFKPKLIIE